MVSVTNAATGRPLIESGREAASAWARFRGLMLRRGLESGEGLVIPGCGSIHMMFMRFPIDAVFYDADRTVTRVAHHVHPWWGLAFGGRRARGVVELAAGAASGVEPGQRLDFEI